MWKILFLYFVPLFMLSCNHIEISDTLNKSDIAYIKSLHLLDSNEKIYKFYSEYKKKNAGNFYTNKRIATYWIDERDSGKNEISFAFYPDIKSIDTVYNAGITYCPYALITKKDGTQFKVSVNGKREEIKSFFEDIIKQWREHR